MRKVLLEVRGVPADQRYQMPEPQVRGRLAIRDARVLDVCGNAMRSQQTIVVEEGLIHYIGSAESVSVPPDCPIVDASGYVVLPGLIDAHVHLMFDGRPVLASCVLEHSIPSLTINSMIAARRTIAAGFTTVRDLGASAGLVIALRDVIQEGRAQGPRIVACGQILTTKGGHADPFPPWVHVDHPFGYVADGVQQVRQAVREQVASGADLIKFCASRGMTDTKSSAMSQEYGAREMEVIVGEAHRAGCLTAAHAHGRAAIDAAVEANVDTIEHGTHLTDKTAARMAEENVFLVPTLSAMFSIIEAGTTSGIPVATVEKAKANRARRIQSFRKALSAGVPIAMGTDAGTPFNKHGSNAHELELLTANGMSPADAIAACTIEAARALGLEAIVGSIAEGKAADMVLVQGNPLHDISVLTRQEKLVVIIKDGHIVVDRREACSSQNTAR